MATCTRRPANARRDSGADAYPADRPQRAFGLRLPDGPVAAAAARRVVHSVLRWWGLPDLADDAALMADELVTNAIEHGLPPVRVRLAVVGFWLICEVADADPTPPRCRCPRDDEERGRGLAVVDALAESWDSRSASDGGKVVFFRLRLPAGWSR